MNPVRPSYNSERVSDGPEVSVGGSRGHECNRRGRDDKIRSVFPVREVDSAVAGECGFDDLPDDMICAPCEEEEQAAVPTSLPSVYQPTRSEYLDHCVTHYPFRAWCKHCLEGRGREFGHDKNRGAKDERPL